MGTVIHDAIVVSSWNDKLLAEAHEYASRLIPTVTPAAQYVVNIGGSFAILPDGSKEGWEESDVGDQARAAFMRWVEAQAHEDGSNSLECVHVRFGSDIDEAEIVTARKARTP